MRRTAPALTDSPGREVTGGRNAGRGCPDRAGPFVTTPDPLHGGEGVHGARRLPRGRATMAKFIYLYRGPATPVPDRTPEQSAAREAAFGAWMEKAGAALADVGSPFGTSVSVRDDGTEGTAGDLI